MIGKLKICAGCKEPKKIWKSEGRDKYCQQCWYSIQPPKLPVKTAKRIAPVSKKMQGQMDQYTKKRTAFLALHSLCQARLAGCTQTATDVHHKKGRGEHYLTVSTWLAVCRPCHNWITEHSKEAIELGLSDSRLQNTLNLKDETNSHTTTTTIATDIQ
jgi:hypothetical protein